MSNLNFYPNYLNTTAQVLKDLLGWAVAGNLLAVKYNDLLPYVAQLKEEDAKSLNLTQVYEALRSTTPEAINGDNGIPGWSAKMTRMLIEDVACATIKRATGCCRRITQLAKTGSATDISTSKDLEFFATDLQVIHAIMSSRKCFIPNTILRNYHESLVNMTAATGSTPAAEVMLNKLRNILKNAPVHMPKKVETKPEEPTVTGEVEFIPQTLN